MAARVPVPFIADLLRGYVRQERKARPGFTGARPALSCPENRADSKTTAPAEGLSHPFPAGLCLTTETPHGPPSHLHSPAGRSCSCSQGEEPFLMEHPKVRELRPEMPPALYMGRSSATEQLTLLILFSLLHSQLLLMLHKPPKAQSLLRGT